MPGPYFFCWLDRLCLLVQSIIKLAQSFARRSEGSVRHAVAGSIDQSKGKHGHDIVRHYNLYKLVMVHVLVGYRRFYSYIYTPRFLPVHFMSIVI